ncbi:protein couch potato [Trichonephila inaurata madagascariensis]|uniref:Protein couch potato n=1 Tax=Trichonephila inaurata madagascariensis TaxID=2747483 RepID=A0A8X6IJW6_9ARAC|nr:protein couch potato [Trichonephila inaurata madagascariensis]
MATIIYYDVITVAKPINLKVRTLFVSGLPMDAKPRELYLLFRAYKGYEGSLLKVTSKNGKTSSPVGFVTFTTRAGAEAAKQDLQRCFWIAPKAYVRLKNSGKQSSVGNSPEIGFHSLFSISRGTSRGKGRGGGERFGISCFLEIGNLYELL